MALDYSQILSGISELKKNNVKDDDIYDHLAGIDPAFKALKDNKVPFNEVVEHLKQTQGGETNNEVKNQPKANEDRNAGRKADQQVDAERREANVQSPLQLRPQDQQVSGGNDNASKREGNGDTIQLSAIAPTEKGGELDGGKEKDAQAKDGDGGQGKEDGKGLQIQGDAGKQAQVSGESGAVPPSPAIQHIAKNNLPITAGVIEELQKAVREPAQAAIAVGSELVEQGVPMLAATKAGAAVGEASSVPLTPLGGAAAGIATGAVVQPLTSALVKGSEDLLGIKDPIEKAQKEFPTLTKAANVAVMAPFAYQSLKNLGSQFFNTMDEQGALQAAMDVAKKIGVATGVGTPIMAATQYATQAAEYWGKLTKEKPEVKLSDLPEMALMSAIMQGYKEAKWKAPNLEGIEGEKTINIPAAQEGGEERLDHAAFNANDQTFTGENHDEALEKAKDAGQIDEDFYNKHKGNKNNVQRNAPEFGYTTNKGRFVSRREGHEIAQNANQLNTDKFLFADKDGVDLHSHEVDLDLSENQPGNSGISNRIKSNPSIIALAARAPRSTDPREQTAWGRMIQKFDLFQDDLRAMGFRGVAENIRDVGAEGFYRVKEATTMLMDTLQGRNVSKLRDAGVFEEATAHAQAKRAIEPWVNTIISEVFPDKYKVSELGKKEVADADWNLMVAERELNRIVKYGKKKGESDPIKLAEYGKAVADQQKIVDDLAKTSEEVKEKHDRIKPTIDIIVKDNILGGADAIQNQISDKTAELHDLQQKFDEGTAPKGTKGEIKALKENIDDLNEALEEIKKVHDLDQYSKDVEAAKGTDIEQDIERWKKIVHPEMDELYRKANNTTSLPPTERGRVFGARINLLSKNDASKFLASEREDGPYKSVIATEYRNPDIKQDMLSKKAAFNADYSTDVEAILKNSFGTRYNEGTKLDFYKALLKNGVAVMPEKGERVEELKGKPTAMMDIEDWPEFDPKTGKVTRSKKYMYIQRDLVSQVKQILDTTEHPEANPLFSGFNAIQLAAPTDAIVHSKNLLSIVTSALGRDSATADVINKIPFLNTKNAIQEIYSVLKEIEADTPKIRKEKAEIARMSGLRPHFDQGGIMKLLSKPQHDFLYYTDMASRIIMNRRYQNLVDRGLVENSAEAKIDFINQIGEYNRRMMSRLESNMRDFGMSPFVVAGRAMNRFSRRLVLMSPGFKPKDAEAQLKARLYQASGLAMATLVPALVNMITTGHFWGRPGTPIGAIDFGSNFDTSDDKHRVLDFYQLMNMRRGFRQLGFDAAFNGWRNGDSFANIFNNIKEDAKTVSMHPFVGPAAGFTYASLTGQRLDLRSGFQNVYLTRKIEGPAGLLENARVALKQQNQFVYDLGVGAAIEKGMEMYGIPKPVGGDESETLRDLGIPQHVPIFRQLYNIGATAAGAAGGKLVVSPAMKLSAQLGTKEQYNPEQDIRFDYRKRINELHRAGKEDEARALYAEGLEKKILTTADKKALSNQYKHPNVLFQRVERMKDPSDSISVFRVATPEEQDNIGPLIWKRISNSTSILKEQKDKLHNEMKSFAKEGSVLYKTIHSESK